MSAFFVLPVGIMLLYKIGFDLEIEDINALSQKYNSSDIIEIKIKEFHDWIGVPLPKELEHKKTILDFFKKKKSEN